VIRLELGGVEGAGQRGLGEDSAGGAAAAGDNSDGGGDCGSVGPGHIQERQQAAARMDGERSRAEPAAAKRWIANNTMV